MAVAINKDPSIAELRKPDLPFVVVGRPENAYENEINWVDNDNFNAVYNLTKHMIDQFKFIREARNMLKCLNPKNIV